MHLIFFKKTFASSKCQIIFELPFGFSFFSLYICRNNRHFCFVTTLNDRPQHFFQKIKIKTIDFAIVCLFLVELWCPQEEDEEEAAAAVVAPPPSAAAAAAAPEDGGGCGGGCGGWFPPPPPGGGEEEAGVREGRPLESAPSSPSAGGSSPRVILQRKMVIYISNTDSIHMYLNTGGR